MGVFKNVLVATDFSEASRGAVDLAVALAEAHGAGLTVLHAVEVPTLPEGMPPVDVVTPLTEAASARLGTLLELFRARLPGARRVVRVGSPWEQILEAAREIGADLVVVGTHGRRGVSHVIMGSVAERVVRLSHLPVLTVRGSAR